MQIYDYSGITKAGSKFLNDEEGITNYLYSTYAKSLSYNRSYTSATIKLAKVDDIRSATFTFKGNSFNRLRKMEFGIFNNFYGHENCIVVQQIST